VAATRGDHPAAGRHGGAAACPHWSPLPARCAGRGDSQRRHGGGRVAGLSPSCSARGVTLAEERFRPREP
jgi:hypothetical protein